MTRLAGISIVLVLAVTSWGCQGGYFAFRSGSPSRGPVVAHEPGPPPHAPAHGYQRKHVDGAELRFDPDLDVYVVVGRTDVYYHDGLFIRMHGDDWEFSAGLGGPWERKEAEWVPPGLRSKHHGKSPHAHEKSKGRSQGPAKADW